MRRHDFGPSFPLGFKLWFGFVAALVVLSWVGIGYLGYSVIQAGPEGLGRLIGQVIKGAQEGQKP